MVAAMELFGLYFIRCLVEPFSLANTGRWVHVYVQQKQQKELF